MWFSRTFLMMGACALLLVALSGGIRLALFLCRAGPEVGWEVCRDLHGMAEVLITEAVVLRPFSQLELGHWP